MKIVIPTAGYGTRLRPHTWSKPKPLITLAGNTVLGHVLDMFSDLPQVEEVIFIVGYLGDQIEAYVSETYPDLNARYVVQEEMIGQSHAVWLARASLQGPMLMVFVDTLIDVDLSMLHARPAEALIWVKPVEDPRRFGVVEVDEGGWVRRLVEKPQEMENNLAVVGFYYFPAAERLIEAIEMQMDQGIQLKGEYFLADAVNIMLAQGLKMRAQPVEIWLDCGKPETVLETNRYLLEHGYDNSGSAADREGVVVVPPVFIDPSAHIRHSVIGPHVTVGARCTIERSLIHNSVIDAEADIRDSMLAASLIGRQARVGGRARSLNLGDTSEVDFA